MPQSPETMSRMRAIQMIVARFYGISLAQMTNFQRARRIARPRMLAMYLCRKLTQKSYPDIARAFKKKDHTTVLHAERVIEELLRQHPELQSDFVEIMRQINLVFPQEPVSGRDALFLHVSLPKKEAVNVV